MRLYESVLGCLYTAQDLSDFIGSTISVMQGCPLSPSLFGIYVDEIESFLQEHIQECDGHFLEHVLISQFLFVNDLILLTYSPKGLQRKINVLSIFCDLQRLTISMGKMKVMIFNASKNALVDYHFSFHGGEIEITTTYTYLGVHFTRPCCNVQHAL
jgi:hypothetical protein